ncbi:hypothetical protein BC828DRAFT_375082 [Blastocladiella britannica]|nr:hypothetical protein BC828DRAFT_375082 [Blastocladiella britannica]
MTTRSDSHQALADELKVTKGLDALPHTVLVHILRHVPDRISHLAAAQTCSALAQAVSAIVYRHPVLDSVELLQRFLASAAASRMNRRVSFAALSTTRLTIAVPLVGLLRNELVTVASQCPNLRTLSLLSAPEPGGSDNNTVRFGSGFRIGDAVHIGRIGIQQSYESQSGPAAEFKIEAMLQRTPQLVSLTLQELHLSDGARLIGIIASTCPRLSYLAITRCSGVPWSAVGPVLGRFKSLRTLSLTGFLLDPDASMSQVFMRMRLAPSVESVRISDQGLPFRQRELYVAPSGQLTLGVPPRSEDETARDRVHAAGIAKALTASSVVRITFPVAPGGELVATVADAVTAAWAARGEIGRRGPSRVLVVGESKAPVDLSVAVHRATAAGGNDIEVRNAKGPLRCHCVRCDPHHGDGSVIVV